MKTVWGITLLCLLQMSIFQLSIGADLLTNYEYYVTRSGLSVDQTYFTLNGINITILGGAMHYFRVPRAYWRDRLKKIRAAGLNTVETYIPWNIHEPQNGTYEFGESGSEMEDFAHLEEFIKIAQEEDLFVILGPGPYISAEYNFGGFPSWLLREQVGFRTTESKYINYVERYFNVLLPILKRYQFTRGGPVIAFQLENKYASMEGYGYTPEREYLEILRQLYVKNDIVELLVTCDDLINLHGTMLDEVLPTFNFIYYPSINLDQMKALIKDKPLLAEHRTAYFDNWGDVHHIVIPGNYGAFLRGVLGYPASASLYMFHGGTNFGFTNGGVTTNTTDISDYEPVTTSYDYDAPLNEAGDYTDKYLEVRTWIGEYGLVKTYLPDLPPLTPKVAYNPITIDKQLSFADILDKNGPYVINSENLIAMEMLDINNNSGQSVGYIVYRKENVNLEANTVLMIEGRVYDTVMVMVDGVLVSPILTSKRSLDGFGYWRQVNSTLLLNKEEKSNATIDIIVEEWGRISNGSVYQYNQSFKGLWEGGVCLNNNKISDWKIIPLEFKKNWTNNLDGWTDKTSNAGPALFHANLDISDEPSDTFLYMYNWTRGLVIVNGFPLGKYATPLGPQQALYLPAPFLRKGSNDIVIFEHFKADDTIKFVVRQIWQTPA